MAIHMVSCTKYAARLLIASELVSMSSAGNIPGSYYLEAIYDVYSYKKPTSSHYYGVSLKGCRKTISEWVYSQKTGL